MPIFSSCYSSSSSSSSSKSWILSGLAVGAAMAAALGARAYLVQSGRCWSRASASPLVVATDDEKIAECCQGFGAEVIMTSESCRNGTERCNEALQKLGKKYDIVVNIQGDEPLIEPEIIDGIVKALQAAPDAVFSTAVTSLKPEDAFDPNCVKCVVDNRGYAIYFSRGLIPYNKSGKVNPQFPYLQFSYDSKFLKIYSELEPTPLQLEEDLEQLKVLENGYKMKVIKVDHETHGVDTREDVGKIEQFMREQSKILLDDFGGLERH
uniref:Cmp-2-keto-3-deoctulosonate (Cmp-kdo) cytidyltransferase n=1 Tax=Solanum tuberosum TaxID=4113 RepID=M1AX86_SOLTU